MTEAFVFGCESGGCAVSDHEAGIKAPLHGIEIIFGILKFLKTIKIADISSDPSFKALKISNYIHIPCAHTYKTQIFT